MVEPILSISNLNKQFGALRATKNLSLDITQGHLHALIGPNGAGKTTLVNQLTGDIIPDSGSIIYNKKNITSLKPHQRAKLGIARSFQITHIFENLTVAENLALSIYAHCDHNFRFWQNSLKTKMIQKELPNALARVGLKNQGDQPAKSLSHGEKRQLEVGMALTGDPKLLILDEPMAGMGPGGTVELTKLINTLKSSYTILLVEHDMDIVFSLADQITVLVYGENIITGSPDEIRQNKQVREAYLGEEE